MYYSLIFVPISNIGTKTVPIILVLSQFASIGIRAHLFLFTALDLPQAVSEDVPPSRFLKFQGERDTKPPKRRKRNPFAWGNSD